MSDLSGPQRGRRVLRSAAADVCLGFVNTVAWRLSDTPEERLPSPQSLLDWCMQAHLVSPSAAERLSRADVSAAYEQAIPLRETMYELFRSKIISAPVPAKALEVLNAALMEATPRVAVAATDDEFGWRVGPVSRSAILLLTPLAWSAADLLTGPRADRVRQCQDERGCGWLFLDESRAGNRRWCSMGNCGNRAKARRHYQRAKHAGAEVKSIEKPPLSRG
jgi:predicted RNA-binding Zn ribbon-like protein